jgi:hypothetical protein
MMNANEAKKYVTAYIEAEAAKVIEKIDLNITKLSKEGGKEFSYYLPNAVREDVRGRILAIIEEAGYEVRYAQATHGIYIKW